MGTARDRSRSRSRSRSPARKTSKSERSQSHKRRHRSRSRSRSPGRHTSPARRPSHRSASPGRRRHGSPAAEHRRSSREHHERSQQQGSRRRDHGADDEQHHRSHRHEQREEQHEEQREEQQEERGRERGEPGKRLQLQPDTELPPPPGPPAEGEPPGPPAEDKLAPNLGLSGKLAAETNTVNGVVLKFQPPAEAKVATKRWRLYVFKNGKLTDQVLALHKMPYYLFGRDHKVADYPIDHPSCSKQHAVICHRLTEKADANGVNQAAVRPYLMCLGAVNGTFINDERVEPQRFYELLEKDMLKFGLSTREYVLLHEDLV